MPAVVTWCALLGVVFGCGQPPSVVETELPEAQVRLMSIKNAYTAFTEQRGRPPRNEKELQRQLADDSSPEVLTSPRDGQPFKVCYGATLFGDLAWASPDSIPALAFEQQGADGTKWVLTIPGAILEVPDDEFAKVVFPPNQ